MIIWLNENEVATIEDVFDRFGSVINSMVNNASLGMTSADERSSTISMRCVV